MTQQSQPISKRYVVRQENEPNNPGPPWVWINPTGGQNGNNSERYIYNDDTDSWELDNSSGPDTPLHPSSGALWRDTSAGKQKSYDGGWNIIGVTDHTNLSGVNPGNHHTRYADSEAQSAVGITLTQVASGSVSVTRPASWEIDNSDIYIQDDEGGFTSIYTISDGNDYVVALGKSGTSVAYRVWRVES